MHWIWQADAMNVICVVVGLMAMCSVLCDTNATTINEQMNGGVSLEHMPEELNYLDSSTKNKKNESIPIPNFISAAHDKSYMDKRQTIEQIRNQGDWHCNTTTSWKDLGAQHYPRFVREETCATGLCMHGFYMCMSQIYHIRVLTVRYEHEDEGISVPVSLRPHWRFTEVAVSVGCLCAA